MPRSLDAPPPARRVLRANPAYELIELDRLSAGERRAIAGASLSSVLYGALRPRPGTALGLVAVDCETALLFLTLREAGPLPAFARARLGNGATEGVEPLIAARILEVQGPGGFAAGAPGLSLYTGATGPAGPEADAPGRLGRLALAALRNASWLAVEDPQALARRLYRFNSLPLTPAWQRLLPDEEALRSYLGLQAGGAHGPALAARWSLRSAGAGWLHYQAREGAERAVDARGATYKLYLSPRPEAFAEHFGAILAGLAAARAPGFKIGRDLLGLLRPDKLVVHFRSYEELAEVAARLAESLAGLPVHGVPFTAEVAGDGLISWGVDPPPAESSREGAGVESWRTWLTRRLARSILAARAAGEREPWRSAMERMRLEGVDTETWAPASALWRGAAR